MSDIIQAKALLRKKMLEELKRQPQEVAQQKSKQIQQKAIALNEINTASSILLYASMPDEVNTHDLIRALLQLQKKVLLPRIRLEDRQMFPYEIHHFENDTELTRFGFRAPAVRLTTVFPLEAIDIVLVPGVAFDRQGNRLGRGLGFYDRFLPKLKKNTPRFGLAFDFQICSQVPTELLDVPLTGLVTN